MRRKMMLGMMTAAMTMAMSMTALAGQWKSDANGWWYQNDNGSYPVNTWQWIDGNGDGVAESYYFNGQGYCLMNTITPDGYTVNPSGAWTVNGVVQTQSVASQNVQTPAVPKGNLLDMEPIDEFVFKDFKNLRTNKNQLWSEGFRLSCAHEDSYVEYYMGGAYNTLTFTYAPKEGAGSKLESTIEVYGDNDELLWSSDEINYKSKAETASIDISGQEYIKINLHNEFRYVIGNGTYILFKDAILY